MKQGELKKQGGNTGLIKNWNSRKVVLYDHFLLYFKNDVPAGGLSLFNAQVECMEDILHINSVVGFTNENGLLTQHSDRVYRFKSIQGSSDIHAWSHAISKLDFIFMSDQQKAVFARPTRRTTTKNIPKRNKSMNDLFQGVRAPSASYVPRPRVSRRSVDVEDTDDERASKSSGNSPNVSPRPSHTITGRVSNRDFTQSCDSASTLMAAKNPERQDNNLSSSPRSPRQYMSMFSSSYSGEKQKIEDYHFGVLYKRMKPKILPSNVRIEELKKICLAGNLFDGSQAQQLINIFEKDEEREAVATILCESLEKPEHLEQALENLSEETKEKIHEKMKKI